MRTIAVVNQKGGCGKTTTTINLSAFLASADRRVLVVDMDPQGHATLGLQARPPDGSATMYDLFTRREGPTRVTLRDIVRPVHDRLDLAPADILLSGVPELLAGVPGREDILGRAVAQVRGRYDYVVIDCPPQVGLLTFNALKACSEAIVPLEPSFFSLHGIAKLLETFDMLERETGHRIAPRALVTMYMSRAPFVRAVVDEIHRHLDGRYFQTPIRHSVKLAEAASHGLPIARYCRTCAGFEDYEALAGEVLAQEDALPEEPDVIPPGAPCLTSDGVAFTIEAPAAARVQLAGDFNNWALDGSEMEPLGPVWKKVLRLAPGRYRYRYIVDGRWITDPYNAAVEPSPFGGENSILVLDEERAQ
jgi:chromosome partitioning protein